PGFLVNRVLFPYMNEALLLLTEGASMDAIDKAATSFGMPMGPIALQDLVGLDTSWFAGQVILEAYPDRGVPLRSSATGRRRAGWGRRRGSDSGGLWASRADPKPTPSSPHSWSRTGPVSGFRAKKRSAIGCSWRCFWRRPGRSRRGSCVSRATPTWG